jgi:hypothetical protein
LEGPLYSDCCVGMAKCGQGVHVDVRINGKSDTVDVRRVSIDKRAQMSHGW